MALDFDQTTAPAAPTIPHSREAEEGVIGAVLINPEIFHECRVNIKTDEDFYIHRHQFIWKAYEELFRQNTPVDILTVSEQLDRMGYLQEIGGASYLTALIGQVPSTYNAPSYAEIVHAHFVRRKLIETANQIASLAYNEEKSLTEIFEQASKSLSDSISHGTFSRIRSISEGLSDLYDFVELRRASEELPGIPTGLIDLDKMLGGGGQEDDLILIVGRPGQGKTSILLQIMKNSARYAINQKVHRKRVVLFSLEMSERQCLMRMISQISGIDYQQLQAGVIPDGKEDAYIQAIEELSQLDIVIDDTSLVTPSYIWSRCQILNSERKLDAVFVDSLNLMTTGLKLERADQIADYNSYQLKAIAKSLHIPVYCAQQMNRGIEHRSENARPKLSDLLDGGEKASDIVIFVYHKMDDVKPKFIEASELIIEKQRSGPTGNIPIIFDQSVTLFKNAVTVSTPL